MLERQHSLQTLPPGFDHDGLELLRHLLYGGVLLAVRVCVCCVCVPSVPCVLLGVAAWVCGPSARPRLPGYGHHMYLGMRCDRGPGWGRGGGGG